MKFVYGSTNILTAILPPLKLLVGMFAIRWELDQKSLSLCILTGAPGPSLCLFLLLFVFVCLALCLTLKGIQEKDLSSGWSYQSRLEEIYSPPDFRVLSL